MPKVISYTPAWLSRSSAGFDLFSRQRYTETESFQKSTVNGTNTKEECTGSCRTIARRGTEVFLVVGNTIRWADLCMLKDDWELKRFSKSAKGESGRAQDEEDDILRGTKHKVKLSA